MSLAQHVTQVEGFDYEGPPNLAVSDQDVLLEDEPELHVAPNALCPPVDNLVENKSEWRQLNFAPAEPVNEERHTAAYRVSNATRYAQVATGIVGCWLASGIVFGFAALKPVLVAEGVYSELCGSDHRPGIDVPCAEQDLRLNLFFVAASITANIASLFAGTVLDRWGRRMCWLVSSLFLTIGSILMGSSFAIPEFDGYLVANIFLAAGGTFLFVSSYQLANAFPMHSGTIVAMVTGAFDASAAVFLLYRMVYTATEGRFSVEKFFFGYTIVPILILVAELTYMPRHAYHSFPELEHKIEKAQDYTRDLHDSDGDISDTGTLTRVRSARADRRAAKLDQIEDIAGDAEQREERVKNKEEVLQISRVWGVLHGVPAHRQMLTPWFILLLFLTVLQMLRMNYFIATIRSQYRFMLGSEEDAEAINNFFDVALPIGGVASTPFIGVLLNNLSVPATFGVLTAFIVTIGVLNCLPFFWAAKMTVIAFVVFRPLYYSAISDYATKVFGFATFGRIYGTLVCLSGLVNFVQSGLDALTHGPLQGDPTPINIAMGTGGAIIGAALTVFIALKSRAREDEDEEDEWEASSERQKLLERDDSSYGTTG